MKAISALGRRIAEGLWWVLVRNEPYRYWQSEHAQAGSEVAEMGDFLVSPTTGEVLETLAPGYRWTNRYLVKVLRSHGDRHAWPERSFCVAHEVRAAFAFKASISQRAFLLIYRHQRTGGH